MELKTIEKALLVFNYFSEGETLLGTTELAERIGTNKATMSRVLTTLKKHGFLEQDNQNRRYRLGPAMVKLAQAVYRSLDGKVTTVAKPYANALRDTIGETVHLEVLTGNNIYLAYVAETLNPISINIQIGDQVMPHAHAGSKAIVAFSDDDVIEHWLTQDFIAYTKNTVTDPERLRALFAEIRKAGVAYDYQEYLEEVNAVGAPVFDHENKPVAGILIVAPTYRLRKKWSKKHIMELKKTANAISAKLHSLRKV